MIVLQTELNCSHTRQVTVQLPGEMAPGLYKAVLVLEKIESTESSAPPIPAPQMDRPTLQTMGAKMPPEDQVYYQREMQNLKAEGMDPFEDMGLH